jgi:uncharacterized protein
MKMFNQRTIKELYNAIANSNNKRVKEIIKKNSKILKVETTNGSWLHVASRNNNFEIVKFLVDLGMDINKKGGISNEMPINLAVSEGNIELVKYYLKKGAIFDESEPERNPLFAAIHYGHIEIVKLLVESGINVNIKYRDRTAISFAEIFGRTEIVAYLKKANIKDNNIVVN